VNAGTKGDITPREGQTVSGGVAWSRTKSGPGISSPVVYDGRLYVVEYIGGILGCDDAKTGERIYRERIPSLRQCAASLLACDGKIYALGDDGTMSIVKAGPKFEIVGKNKLDGEFWATPAMVGDAVLLRSPNAVYCVREH
jgi:outer membrane protein assembly factor BamB